MSFIGEPRYPKIYLHCKKTYFAYCFFLGGKITKLSHSKSAARVTEPSAIECELKKKTDSLDVGTVIEKKQKRVAHVLDACFENGKG